MSLLKPYTTLLIGAALGFFLVPKLMKFAPVAKLTGGA